jgi:spore maturation protein SpmB
MNVRISIHVGLVPSVRTSKVDTGVNAQLALMVTHIPQVVRMLMNVHAVHAEGMLSVITCLEASDVPVLLGILETHSMNA